jgi:hypothetical protein
MSAAPVGDYPFVPEYWASSSEEHRRQLAQSINGILQGEVNNGYIVLLEPNETSTTVTASRLRIGQIPNLTACSASAATATGVWVEMKTGSLVVHHDSQPDTDRCFGLSVTG